MARSPSWGTLNSDPALYIQIHRLTWRALHCIEIHSDTKQEIPVLPGHHHGKKACRETSI